jgi:hypothetical protein
VTKATHQKRLHDISQQALGVWYAAVERAEQDRSRIRYMMCHARAEDAARTISGKTLKKQDEEVMEQLKKWKGECDGHPLLSTETKKEEIIKGTAEVPKLQLDKMHAEKSHAEITRRIAEITKARETMMTDRCSDIAHLCQKTRLPVLDLALLVDGAESVDEVTDALSKLDCIFYEKNCVVEK